MDITFWRTRGSIHSRTATGGTHLPSSASTSFLNAGVKKLMLFHHDHLSDDDTLQRLLDSTNNYLNHVAPDADCEALLTQDNLSFTL
jgi:hypothetical protein